MTVWLYVTNDKYELPLAVADSLSILARKLGVSTNTIHSAMSHCRKKGYKCRYVKVVIDDKECEEWEV